MNDMKKNIRRVFFIFFTMFLITTVYLLHFILIGSKDIINSTMNPRVRIARDNIKRGDILDQNGIIIAETVLGEDGYYRAYNYDRAFAHVVGFTEAGYYGVEERNNFQLQNLSLEVTQRIVNVATGSHLTGDSVVLTIDADLQELVYNALGNNNGSVVVMEPSTGKILSMVSYPNFNPNTISTDLQSLTQDTYNTPLFNRATQGLYPPGSIFKIVTSAAAIEHLEDFENFTHNCTGYITFEGNTIRCYNSTAHGAVNISEAFKVSCNTYFVAAANEIGAENLINSANKAYFNKDIPFSLQNNMSRFSLNSADDIGELMQVSIGQGRTLVTPLHMAMLTSAVANDGIMMEPYVVSHVESTIRSKNRTTPQVLAQVFTTEQSHILTNMMTETIQSGTGVPASVSGINVAGKTGTAENDSGDSHGWFVAFAPVEEPQIAVAIVLENSGGPRRAMTMSSEIMNFWLN